MDRRYVRNHDGLSFLNMVIGIVVNVMEEEHAKVREEHQKELQDEVTAEQDEKLNNILAEIKKLQQQVAKQN